MSASIVLTGLAANDPVPGVYLETNFAQGPAAGDSSPREVCLIGNKTTAGSATVNTVIYGPDSPVPLQTDADARALFGPGSELHRMFLRFTAVNKDTTLRAIVVTESIGAAATGTITIATNASGNGNLRIFVGDEFVDTAITSGQTPTNIADAAIINVNAMTHWAVVASNIAGAITLTAKNLGLRGNFIRYMTTITSGIATTSSVTVDTAFTGGTTADSSTTALATLLPKSHYYLVSAAEDATQVGALKVQVDTQASPTTGIRQRWFSGSVDTISNVNTIATGRNAARGEFIWSYKSPWTPGELAANAAAVYSLFETSPNPRTNFASFGNDELTSKYWRVPASRDATAHPTRADIKSALNNGVTPIGVNSNGSTYLVNRITSRSLSGSTVDYRIRDAHKVTICDFFAADLAVKTVLQYSGKRIGSDVARGARPPGGGVVTPAMFKGMIFRLLDDYDGNDLLQNLAAIKEATVVQRETNPSTRMSVRIPLQPIDNALQFAIAIDQVA